MGCVSDLVPMRSPIFEMGIVISTVMMYLVATHDENASQNQISILTFILGGTLTGATIIIAAIECDIGVYVS